jgi:hypothetical protein
MSPRIYESKLADSKIDERLIPRGEKKNIHEDSIREAVAVSQNRMRDINEAVPAMIDKTVDDAAKYTRAQDDKTAEAFCRLGEQHDEDRERELSPARTISLTSPPSRRPPSASSALSSSLLSRVFPSEFFSSASAPSRAGV